MSWARRFSASKENGAGAPIFRPCLGQGGPENPAAARPAVAVAD